MSTNPVGAEVETDGARTPETSQPSRWSRRRVLGWALGATATVGGGGWGALTWKQNTEAQARAAALSQEAAWFCFARHPEAALRVERALQVSNSFAPALLLRACLDVEAGQWEAARRTLSRAPLSATPEAKLLLELATRRPDAPDWRHAFFDSWQALGRPHLEKSSLLPAPLDLSILLDSIDRNWDTANEAQRFTLRVFSPASKAFGNPIWLLKQIHGSSSVPLLMALCLQLAHPDCEPDLQSIYLGDVQERLQQLAGSSPPSLQLALLPFVKDGRLRRTEPFQRDELEALERALKIPEWKLTSNAQLFQEMRTHFDGLLLAPGHHAWRMVALAQADSLGYVLYHRANASKDHLSDDDQRWLGRLLWDLGARIRKQRSHLEMTVGLRLQMVGSELTRYVPDKEEVVNRWVELGIWDDAVKQAGSYRWPLASLQEDFYAARARDEQAWMTAFTGVNPLP